MDRWCRYLPYSAAYVVFNCFDTMERGLSGNIKYYGSIDLIDAYHPQTILAYELNGGNMPIANGAPLRVRVERQLGYKIGGNCICVSIELVSSFSKLGGGHGWLLGRSWLQLVCRHLGNPVPAEFQFATKPQPREA